VVERERGLANLACLVSIVADQFGDRAAAIILSSRETELAGCGYVAKGNVQI
jgi:hypothetical protein